MCGIFIAISKKKIFPKKEINSAIKNLSNRGPDFAFHKIFLNKVLFINTILSVNGKINKKKIISSNSDRFHISYNGEIYNQKELEKKYNLKKNFDNDTVFLANLHDYEKPKKIMKLLNGMFAYAVFDKKKNKIFFGCDPQGEKKLFIFNNNDYFILSSNIDSIQKFVKKNFEINYSELESYFSTRHFCLDEKTIYKNINIVKNFFTYSYDIKNNNLQKTRYDNPINWISKKKYMFFMNKKKNKVIEYFDQLFKKVAKNMLPEIKFGSIFSGGVDSSLQSYYLSHDNNLKNLYCLHHPKKDKITENNPKFHKFIKQKIIIQTCNATH